MKLPEILPRRAMKRGPIPITLTILALIILGAILSPWSPVWKQKDINRSERNQLKTLEAMLEQNAIGYQTKVVSEMLKGVLVAKADFVGRWADGMKIDTTGTFVTNQTFSQLPITFPIDAGSWWRVINDSCQTADGELLYYVKSYDPADRTGPVTYCFVLPAWFRGILGEDLERFDQELAQQKGKAQQQQVQKAAQITFSSVMPAGYWYDCQKDPVTLGYVNPGDILKITPWMESDYVTWDPSPAVTDGIVYDLAGSPRPANTCGNPQQFLAPNLNLGALLINIPGNGWQILDQQMVFTIKKSGEVKIGINDRQGCYKDNEGEIGLDIKLTPGTST